MSNVPFHFESSYISPEKCWSKWSRPSLQPMCFKGKKEPNLQPICISIIIRIHFIIEYYDNLCFFLNFARHWKFPPLKTAPFSAKSHEIVLLQTSQVCKGHHSLFHVTQLFFLRRPRWARETSPSVAKNWRMMKQARINYLKNLWLNCYYVKNTFQRS